MLNKKLSMGKTSVAIYNYVTKHMVDKPGFKIYMNAYNNTISKLIELLYKIKYTPKNNTQPIQLHEDCIYY
jgi:NADPH-dependent 7-cyano-7-deazaguanine reductase QueF-like protein